jgi:hypothetical protein
MAHTALAALVHYLRSLPNSARVELSDRELLRQYVANHDEAAFAALLHRHVPSVWSVCRCLLDNFLCAVLLEGTLWIVPYAQVVKLAKELLRPLPRSMGKSGKSG